MTDDALPIIKPGDPTPELPFVDDDWFRHYHRFGDRDTVVASEVHELCDAAACDYRPTQPCPWHPPGCDCSLGACQQPVPVAGQLWRRELNDVFHRVRGSGWTPPDPPRGRGRQ
jgi:hypothetical protein